MATELEAGLLIFFLGQRQSCLGASESRLENEQEFRRQRKEFYHGGQREQRVRDEITC